MRLTPGLIRTPSDPFSVCYANFCLTAVFCYLRVPVRPCRLLPGGVESNWPCTQEVNNLLANVAALHSQYTTEKLHNLHVSP